MRRLMPALVGLATLSGCSSAPDDLPVDAGSPETAVSVRSATVKRSSGKLITALRGSATPGATIEVDGRETVAGANGRWAIRTSYDRHRDLITVAASINGRTDSSADVPQPLRPRLILTSSTGATTTQDSTELKGRVRVSRGTLTGVRITVNGRPITLTGSRWSTIVAVPKGTRRFTVRAASRSADGATLTMRKTRKLSAAERAERAAAKAAKRAAARQAREAARLAEEAEASSGSSDACDPNYSGACLDPEASDYDCAGGSGDGPEYVDGPVEVVGSDPFDLDRDSDGVGCE
ncbi:MAG: hypothetical protein J7513_11735 [Solirubrobacteraceae bacterium]|nr:hypothetical protein [Solirubrobacteraceae bacterium]